MNPFSDIMKGFKALGIACLVMLPLATWKAVEIAIWITRNLEISLK